MEFSDAASYFYGDEVFDAYTGELLFTARASSHDDHTSSGATSRRRTLITDVGSVAPARRALRWYDTFWIVGGDNTDGFQGGEVRRNFDIKKSSGIVTSLTPGAAARGAPGVDFHMHKDYYRDMTDGLTSSDMDVMWNVFCPVNEPVAKGAFLREGASLMRVRNLYRSADGFVIAEADQLDLDALQSVTFTARSPTLDFDTPGAPTITTVSAIQTDSAKLFSWRTDAEFGYKPGDRLVLVAKSDITPKTGDNFVMLGANWRVVTAITEQDAWAIRARLA